MNLKEYWHDLISFDWFYFCSDDQSVWRLGNESKKKLEMMADTEDKKQLFLEFEHEATMAWREQRSAHFPTEKSLDRAIEADAFPHK